MEVGCTRPVARGPDLQEGPLSAQEGPPRTVPPDALLSPTCTHTQSHVRSWAGGWGCGSSWAGPQEGVQLYQHESAGSQLRGARSGKATQAHPWWFSVAGVPFTASNRHF